MEDYRKKLKEYDHKWNTYEKAISDKEKERQQNCQNIIDNERLRNEKAGPPKPRWGWGQEDYEKRDEKGEDRELLVKGWFPPPSEVPSNPWPWERNSDGQMSREDRLLPEYYLLAIFHDYMLFDHQPLIITEEFAAECELIGMFRSFARSKDGESAAGLLFPSYEKYLPAALKDVQRDIALLSPANADVEGKDEWLTVKKAAKLLKVTPGRISQLCDEEKVKWEGHKKARRVSRMSITLYKIEHEAKEVDRETIKAGQVVMVDNLKDDKDVARDKKIQDQYR